MAIAFVVIAGFSLVACCLELENARDDNQTPVASDYDIGNLIQTAGNVTPVTVTPKAEKSPGTISGIRYNGSTTVPQVPGTYLVTFDVAAAPGWNAATGLIIGTLTINTAPTQTPVASDYDIGSHGTLDSCYRPLVVASGNYYAG